MNSGRVALVVGCGLMGTSAGLGLRSLGVTVHLADLNPRHLEMAVGRGAGLADAVESPDIVIIAVPPLYVVDAVLEALDDYPDAVVTDVASIKSLLAERVAGHPGAARYVGSHPMAGNERSGPLAGSGRLFEGRPWAVCPHARSDANAVALVESLAVGLDATVVRMDPADHDAAVALVSHMPHLMSVLTASRLVDAEPDYLALAGPGLRDVTRIAGSDPYLWRQILRGNAPAVTAVLNDVRNDLDRLIDHLEKGHDVEDTLSQGREGTRRLPSRHGVGYEARTQVFVQVADRTGELRRLLADTTESNVGILDIRIDHDLGREVGLAELEVEPQHAEHLVEALVARGWTAYR